MPATGQETRAALGHEVVEIVGPLDDLVVAEIVATGATAAEVLEAYDWLNADDYLGGELERPKQGRVAEVLAILETQLPPSEERRPPAGTP